jgi:hypothetical protein
MAPGNSTMQSGKTTMTREQAQINKERQRLRRDVRLGRTTQAARLRRQINANERASTRARQGGQETSGTQPMPPLPPAQSNQVPNQNDTQRNQTNK